MCSSSDFRDGDEILVIFASAASVLQDVADRQNPAQWHLLDGLQVAGRLSLYVVMVHGWPVPVLSQAHCKSHNRTRTSSKTSQLQTDGSDTIL